MDISITRKRKHLTQDWNEANQFLSIGKMVI